MSDMCHWSARVNSWSWMEWMAVCVHCRWGLLWEIGGYIWSYIRGINNLDEGAGQDRLERPRTPPTPPRGGPLFSDFIVHSSIGPSIKWIGWIITAYGCYRLSLLSLVEFRFQRMTVLLVNKTDFYTALTHLPFVPHICVSESGHHWFR